MDYMLAIARLAVCRTALLAKENRLLGGSLVLEILFSDLDCFV